ncbi:MAG: helix-turn-helix domain-containing protein [Mesorhizobium sp.]
MTDHDDNPDWSDFTPAPLDTALKLQAIRARLRMSQGQLADLLHVPLATLRNWEQTRTEPSAFARHMIDVIYDDPDGMRERLDRRDRRTAA